MKLNYIYYAYFGRREDAKHEGIVTAAFEIVKGAFTGTTYIRAAFAYCSPLDQFCKKKGRHIAMKRLQNGKTRNNRGTHDQAVWSMPYEEGDNAIAKICSIFNVQVPKYCKPQWANKQKLELKSSKEKK